MPLNDAYHVGSFNFMEKNMEQNLKNLKKGLAFYFRVLYNTTCRKRKSEYKGLSPNGKATDSDSVISRFESL